MIIPWYFLGMGKQSRRGQKSSTNMNIEKSLGGETIKHSRYPHPMSLSSANRIYQLVKQQPGLFFALLILILLGAFSLHKVTNFDIGWHIKAGEYIVTNWKAPGLDIFSYTAADRPYLDSHWLFQVVVYTVYALLGVYGLNLLIVLIAGAVFIILFRCVGFMGNPYIASYFFVLAILAGSDRLIIRPELFTFLLIATYLYILHKHGCGRKLYLLPLLQILWVNMHGLFVLGLVMVLCYIIGGLASWKLRLPFEWNKVGALDRKGFLRLVLVFGLMVLASFVNPYGHRLAFFPATLFIEVSKLTEVVSAFISEQQSPFSNNPQLNREAILFYKLLAICSMLTFMFSYRRLNLSQSLLFAAFFYISTLAVRNITLFAIVAAPIAVYNMGSGRASFDIPGYLRRFHIGSFLRWGASVGIVLFMVYYLLSVFSNDYYLRNGSSLRNGAGLSEVSYPKGAIDFVQRNGIKGNVFNTPRFGGYFIWRSFPRQKVFSDTRFGFYGYEFYKKYSAMLDNPGYFNAVANSYGVNYGVVKLSSRPLVSLYKDPAWMIVYCDEVAVVFVKNIARNQKAIDNARCDLETEATSDVGTIERSYLERIDEGFFSRTMRLVRLFREGSDPITHFNRGTFFHVMGFKNRAEEELLKSLAMFPHQQMAHYNLGVTYYYLGRFAEAIEEYKRAIKLNPGFAMTHNDLGLAYHNLGRHVEAIGEYKEALRLNPDYARAHNNLGLTYHDLGRHNEAIGEFKEALRLESDLAEAYNNLGLAYANLGLTAEAIEEYRKALRLKPDYMIAYNNLGAAYYKDGRTDEAIKQYKEALRLNPGFADTHFNLALAYREKGLKTDAIREFKEYLRLNPRDSEARKMLEGLITEGNRL
jgi:tetratricopeptide (TPR) repeat protein